MKWYPFDETRGLKQKLPLPNRYVLLQIAEDDLMGMPARVVVGYRKDHADRIKTPYFVHPGCNFKTDQERGGYYRSKITHWSDCLGDDFYAPLWAGKQISKEK
jgi:hypothetical protein